MRAKPKGSGRKSRAARSPGSRPGQAARRAGSSATRRSPAPRQDAAPIGRNSGALKHIGGSQSDEWNDRLAAETAEATPRLEGETRDQRIDAALHGLIGLAPADEIEGIMAAELIAAHAAAMECYRRATGDEHEFGKRDENLRHANRLSRTVVALSAALERRRHKAPKAASVGEGAGSGAQKFAKQPHPEIPRERAARLEGVRRRRDPVDFDALNEEEAAAIDRLWELAEMICQGLRPGDLDALEKTLAEAKAALTKSAKQPSGTPAPAPPRAPEAESAKQPSGAPAPAPPRAPAQAPVAAPAVVPRGTPDFGEPATARTESAKQPPAMSYARARELMGPGTPHPTLPGRTVYTLPPDERDEILAALQAETRAQLKEPSHGTIAPLPDPVVRSPHPERDAAPGPGNAEWPLPPARRT